MPDHSLPISPRPAWASFDAVEEAAHAARACRIATGEVMTDVVEDWVVREHAGGRIERLAPLADFRDEDVFYPA